MAIDQEELIKAAEPLREEVVRSTELHLQVTITQRFLVAYQEIVPGTRISIAAVELKS